MIIQLIRKLIALLSAGSKLPDDWTDESQVQQWLAGLNSPLAALIVLAAEQLKNPPLYSGHELRTAVVTEAELVGVTLPPAVIESIVQLLLYVLSLFGAK